MVVFGVIEPFAANLPSVASWPQLQSRLEEAVSELEAVKLALVEVSFSPASSKVLVLGNSGVTAAVVVVAVLLLELLLRLPLFVSGIMKSCDLVPLPNRFV